MSQTTALRSMLMRGALSLIADIVAAVYDCRSLPFRQVGYKNNSHSSNANEDFGAPTELGYPSLN